MESPMISRALHEPQNSYLHVKSQTYILKSMSRILSGLIEEGNRNGEFSCESPQESAEIILSPLVFLLDEGVFDWRREEFMSRLKVISLAFSLLLGFRKDVFQDLLEGLDERLRRGYKKSTVR